MIVISTNTAVMLYLILTLALLLVLWSVQHFRQRSKKVIVAKDELFKCEFCHFAYLSDRSKKVTQCPECKSFNKDNRFF